MSTYKLSRGLNKRELKHLAYQAYLSLKIGLNRGLDSIINRSNEAAMQAYSLSTPSIRHLTQKSARAVSDISLLLKNSPRLNAWRLVGPDWSLIYVGNEIGKNELSHVMFPHGCEEVDHGRVNVWKLPELTKEWLSKYDLVVCEVSRRYPFSFPVAYTFMTPPWIRQVIDISGPEEEFLAKANRNLLRNLRKIKSSGFTYEFSKSKTDFDRAYEMYVTYSKLRYGERVGIVSYESLWHSWFLPGGLIQVKQDQQLVGSMGCRIRGNTAFAGATGILNGDFHLVEEGVALALLWFAVDWSRQQGVNFFDFGRTRARQADGVFYTKRRWGAKVVSCYSTVHENWHFLSNDLSPQLRNFINEQGFIMERNDQHYSVRVMAETEPMSDSLLAEQKKIVQRNGLDGLLFIRPHTNNLYLRDNHATTRFHHSK